MSDRHPDDTDADIIPQPPLAPCPWCGATSLLLDLHERGYWVECDNGTCPVTSETRTCDTPALAAERRNTRAPAVVN